jgi:hypothetical protein
MHRIRHYQSSSHSVGQRDFRHKRLSKSAFAPQFNTVEQEWISNKKFTDITNKCAQIHHTGQDHWVTSVQSDTNETYILDILFEKLTVSQEIQLSQIYSHGKKRLLVKMPEIHKQTNSIDCGLYAIANAVECCLTGYTGGLHITLDQIYMRDHLISCLEKNQLRPFPKCFISKKSKVKSQNFIIETNCECGETDGIQNMVGCEWTKGIKTCNTWKHKSCASPDSTNTRYCSKHKPH